MLQKCKLFSLIVTNVIFIQNKKQLDTKKNYKKFELFDKQVIKKCRSFFYIVIENKKRKKKKLLLHILKLL